MKSSFLSVSVVGMALANFVVSLPHELNSGSIVAGGQPGPHLFRRQPGQKRQATTDATDYNQGQSAGPYQANLNNNQRMQLATEKMKGVSNLMQMVRSEADFSAFITTFGLHGHSPGTEERPKEPYLDALSSNYAELEGWANAVNYVRSDLMGPGDFQTMFPMVAHALTTNTGNIPELDALPASAYGYRFWKIYCTLLNQFPGLANTVLPNNLVWQTLNRIPYFVKGHLAAHFVRQENLEGLKQIIRAWIAIENKMNSATPLTNEGTDSAKPKEMENFDDDLLELTDMMASNRISDPDPQAGNSASGTNDSMIDEDDFPDFDANDNRPLDASESNTLPNSRFRVPIATLYMWAMEYEVLGYETLFTEFGNPFRNRDIPCFLALDYGYVSVSPNGPTSKGIEIRVRHNRNLNPQVTLAPDDEKQNLEGIRANLNILMESIKDSYARKEIDE
ncbi:hypothetical protein H4R33_006992, partial [Dimargaris cristalligena]